MIITFIGGGNMATAMIAGLVRRGHPADALRVVEVAAQAREKLQRDFAVSVFSEPGPALRGSNMVVLAVKPQQMRAVAGSVRPLLDRHVLISIAAGIRSDDLARWLGGYERIIRDMPNTPALVGAGVSALFARPGVAADEKEAAQGVLQSVGAAHWLDREEDMDAVTAVSGSGPAYVFYFLEALQQAALELGLPPALARSLSLETFRGASKLAVESEEDPATLRARVTSKGGTTEAALAVMETQQVKQRIITAVRAAAARSSELGDALGETD